MSTAPRAKYVVESMEEGVSGLRHEAKTKAHEAEFLGDLIWRLEQDVKFYQSELDDMQEIDDTDSIPYKPEDRT